MEGDLPENTKNDEYFRSYSAYAEPLLRASVAGFGGILAGLAVVRYRRQAPLMSSVDQSVSYPVLNSRRKIMMIPRQTTSSNLPAVWGLSCLTFSAVLDITRLYEPTKILASRLQSNDMKQLNPYFCTCSDYALGGALAGATFRGMQLTSSHRQRLTLRPSFAMGLLAGMALGLFAGVLQATFDYIETEWQPSNTEEPDQSR